MQPVADEESSSGEPPIAEPERIETKQGHVSHDSDEKPPKGKAKIEIKKHKVQLPGHQEPIVPPTVNDEDDEHTSDSISFKWSVHSFTYNDFTFVYSGTAGR